MAIVKMKKLRLIAVRSRKEELLEELTRLGCVEVSEIGDSIAGSELEQQVKKESSDIMTFRSQLTSLNHAIEILGRYAPVKGKLLSAKPEMKTDEILNPDGVDKALKLAEGLEALEDRIKRISAEESRQRAVMESLQPWLPMSLPLDFHGTERTSVFMGSVTNRIEIADVRAAVEAASDEAELYEVSEDKSEHYFVVICINEAYTQVQETLRSFSFSSVSFSGLKGTAADCKRECEKQLKLLSDEKEKCIADVAVQNGHLNELKTAADKISTGIALCEAEDKLYGTESSIVMEGWFPAENEIELIALLDGLDCAFETMDPTEEEYPDVPVKLRNNKVTDALNMVTNMYSLPAYDGIDPNPLMAPFFILFYGLMMADMGYGLIMIIAALVAMKKIKPKRGSLSFCRLLLYGGISTFVMGLLTGGFFGDAPLQITQMLNPDTSFTGLPALFSPLNDSLYVLIGAMILGVIQLNTGMVISFVEKCKKGQVLDGIFYEGSLWVVLIGIILYVLKIGNVSGVPVVLVIGLVMLFYGAGRDKKGFGKVTAIFSAIYNEATGWFGDILSYSRIMALMLAGSVIATVFNTIGAITGNIFVFAIIFIIGHVLNFGLNLLGCYVHDLRLQCLEYFGKFYKDGGRAFRPLEPQSKYYDVV